MQKEGKVIFFMHLIYYMETSQIIISIFHVSSEICIFNPHCSLNVRVDDVQVNLDKTGPLCCYKNY